MAAVLAVFALLRGQMKAMSCDCAKTCLVLLGVCASSCARVRVHGSAFSAQVLLLVSSHGEHSPGGIKLAQEQRMNNS